MGGGPDVPICEPKDACRMQPQRPPEPTGAPPLPGAFLGWDMAHEPVQRHCLGLEPRQAWRLKGTGGETDEIVVPGILLDDLGRTSSAEAVMGREVFCQLQALAAMAEIRMLEARARARPRRMRAEANVWLVDGVRKGRRIEVTGIVSLDRVVFAADRHLCTDTIGVGQLVPGDKAWR